MTRPVLPPTPEVPEPGLSALHALYHEGATAEPSLSLDRSILDAARAELRNNGVTKRQAPWWKGWLPATSAIAAVVVGLSVTWRVMDEQERHLREEMRAAQAENEMAGNAAPAQRPAEAQPLLSAPVPAPEKARRAESAVIKDAQPGVPEPEAKPAPAAPATMAPALAEEAMKKGERAEKNELRDRRDVSAVMDSAAGPARALGKIEAKSLGASGATAADTVAQPAADAATPEAWLKQIRELRAAGRSAEAAQSLARFRARYPDFVLPDDLLKLK